MVLGPSWRAGRTIVRTLRSPLPGTARIPSRVLTNASPAERRAAGRFLYKGTDVVHRMDLRLPPSPGIEALTVHDVVPWRFPDEARIPPAVTQEARRSTVVISPSQFSADEISTVLGVKRVVVVPNGVGEEFLEAIPLDEEELTQLGVRRPFVVHAGGCGLRKNLGSLAEAWPAVWQHRPDMSLVLLGPPDPRRDDLFGGLPHCVRLGRIASDLVPRVMASAAAIVVPSVYEGFGLPALEAMAVGTPLVASNRASLPEICKGAGFLVEPTAAGLAEGLVAALAGGPDVDGMVGMGRKIARRHTWDASARAHAELWQGLIA